MSFLTKKPTITLITLLIGVMFSNVSVGEDLNYCPKAAVVKLGDINYICELNDYITYPENKHINSKEICEKEWKAKLKDKSQLSQICSFHEETALSPTVGRGWEGYLAPNAVLLAIDNLRAEHNKKYFCEKARIIEDKSKGKNYFCTIRPISVTIEPRSSENVSAIRVRAQRKCQEHWSKVTLVRCNPKIPTTLEVSKIFKIYQGHTKRRGDKVKLHTEVKENSEYCDKRKHKVEVKGINYTCKNYWQVDKTTYPKCGDSNYLNNLYKKIQPILVNVANLQNLENLQEQEKQESP